MQKQHMGGDRAPPLQGKAETELRRYKANVGLEKPSHSVEHERFLAHKVAITNQRDSSDYQ